MPRPKNHLLQSFFRKNEAEQIFCYTDRCNGRLMNKHSPNLERHMRKFHPATYTAYLAEKVKRLHHKTIKKMQLAERRENRILAEESSSHTEAPESNTATAHIDIPQINIAAPPQWHVVVPQRNTEAPQPINAQKPTKEFGQIAAELIKQDPNLFKKVSELWAMKLQNMDPTQALLAEKLINDIIYSAQLGQLKPTPPTQIDLRVPEQMNTLSFPNEFGADFHAAVMKEEFNPSSSTHEELMDFNQQA